MTNRLIAMMLPESRARIESAGRMVELHFGTSLATAGEPVEHVYFPHNGLISLYVLMQDGRGVDASTIGWEGMTGAPGVLGQGLSPCEMVMQISGVATQVPASSFLQLLDEDPELRSLMMRYVEVLMLQVIRTAACNRLHEVEERLARWLLHSHDAMQMDQLHLTQDFLSAMLGVRRASVTIAAGALQRAGMIEYSRGEISILNRAALEEIACEDYAVIHHAHQHLFGPIASS
jgi:CRP-like cAMP-binding protein